MGLAFGALALAAFLSAAMAFAWWVAEKSGRSGWIDAIWTFAVGLAGVASALMEPSERSRSLLVAGIAAVWSLRLGLHISGRTARGGDDPRYRQLREEWGERASSRLFGFLQVQAAAGWVLVLAVAVAAHRPGPLTLQDSLGAALFFVALAGEATADRQLARFAENGHAKGVCDIGLWGWTRHPNYFFEWLTWVAFALIAVDLTGAYPFGWIALSAPVLMYLLLVHVSGVPPLEAHMLRSRGDAFRLYQARVNAFWPGPPRTAASHPGVTS
jgi:steroid 5-alpha reductase family enzyme